MPDLSRPSNCDTLSRLNEGRQDTAVAIEKCINEYQAADVIFEQGTIGHELFVVLDGKVDIVRGTPEGPLTVATLGKGEFFGEMAVIDSSPRSATAIAAEANTRVISINHARFVYLVAQQPAFALMIMDALSRRLRATYAVNLDRVPDLAREPVGGKK